MIKYVPWKGLNSIIVNVKILKILAIWLVKNIFYMV